jgi:hypothetical protein
MAARDIGRPTDGVVGGAASVERGALQNGHACSPARTCLQHDTQGERRLIETPRVDCSRSPAPAFRRPREQTTLF